jgi:cytochrome c5
VHDGTCATCPKDGVAGTPKLGDKAGWGARIKTGNDALVDSAIKGEGAMPAKDGKASVCDAEVKAAVEYMVEASK